MTTGDSIYLGIDCGTSVVKAAAFDAAGNELGVGEASLTTLAPRPGWMEYDPETLWSTATAAVRNLFSNHAAFARRVAAVGVTGAGNGVTLADSKGQPLRNGVFAVDNRATGLPQPSPDFPARARAIHGQSIWSGQTAEVLRWFSLNDPETLKRARLIFVIKDYVKFRLTGVYSSDTSEQSKLGLLDIDSGTTSDRLLDAYGLQSIRGALPPLAPSAEAIGSVTSDAAAATGLPAGTPVVAGLADIDASALGAGATASGQLSIVAGTWSINQFFVSSAHNRTDIFGTSRHAIPGVWEELEASASSTANLTWFVREACRDLERDATARGVSVYDLVNEIVASVEPGTSPVFFHPYLFGSNTQPNARAGFYGLAGWQQRKHLLAALFEGVVFSHAVHVERLLDGGKTATDVRLSGGASRSAVWSQMFSDVLGLPLRVPAAREVGALGAAMCAATGVGAHTSLADAAMTMARSERTHEPNPSLFERYVGRFATFKSITEAMKPVWNALDETLKSDASFRNGS